MFPVIFSAHVPYSEEVTRGLRRIRLRARGASSLPISSSSWVSYSQMSSAFGTLTSRPGLGQAAYPVRTLFFRKRCGVAEFWGTQRWKQMGRKFRTSLLNIVGLVSRLKKSLIKKIKLLNCGAGPTSRIMVTQM